MDNKEKDKLRSDTIGCGRAKIIAEAIKDTLLISELEEGFITGHMRLCEKCNIDYGQLVKNYQKVKRFASEGFSDI